jgi:hypothetical protein
MNIQDLLHKRVLVAEKERGYSSSNRAVKEIKILEIAPSGNWVKIMNDNGNKYWLHSSDITPIEVLASLETKPRS